MGKIKYSDPLDYKKSNLVNLVFNDSGIHFGVDNYCALVDLTDEPLLPNKLGFIT